MNEKNCLFLMTINQSINHLYWPIQSIYLFGYITLLWILLTYNVKEKKILNWKMFRVFVCLFVFHLASFFSK